MANSYVQVPPDSTGKQIDTFSLNTGEHRQSVVIGDPATAATVVSLVDADTGAGSEPILPISPRKAKSGGSVEYGTSTDPIRTDPTGTTIQPVSGTLSITANSAMNVAQVAGTAASVNNGTVDAGTLRVTMASDSTGQIKLAAGSAVVGHVIVDTAPTTAVTGTFFQATQPVSASALPLPTGASTVAKQPALGTAGSASADVITIQGVASMTKLLVTPDSVALPANQSTNVAQVAGTTTDTNSGTKSAGTLRVVIATDQPALTNKLLVTPDSVALPANQSCNTAQMNGVTVTMGNGVSGTGVQRVSIASDSTGQVALSSTLAVTPITVAIAASSSGDNTLIAAVSSKKIYVYAWNLSFSAAVNAKFTDGAAGTNVCGLIYGAANSGGGNSVPPPTFLWGGSTNTALILNLSGAVAVGGSVSYFTI